MKNRTFKQVILTIGAGLLSTFIDAAPGPIAGQTYAVATQGDYAYIGVGNKLNVVNVATATGPVLVGETAAFPDIVQSLEIVGNHAYVAAGAAGLLIVDVLDPRTPKTVGGYDTPGQAQEVYVTGERAYLADGPAGTHIFDISDPSQPVLLGTSTTEGWDWDVWVVNDVAFVAADEQGVRIIDGTDPTNPVQIGAFQTSNDATGVVVEGDFAYVAALGSGLRILNIGDPAAPKEVAFVDSEYARSIYLKDGFAYVAAEREGVLVVNVSDPTRPRPVRRLAARGSANRITAVGNDIFIADGVGALHTFRLSPSRSAIQRERSLSLPISKGSAIP